MLRLFLFVVLLTRSIRTAHVTDSPNVFNRIYQKLEKLNPSRDSELSPTNKLYIKLDRLNSLTPESDRSELSEEDNLISEMQSWLNPEQIGGVVKMIHQLKTERHDSEQDYSDGYWNDEDSDPGEEEYANDDWDELSDSSPILKTSISGVTPSAITKLPVGPEKTVMSAAATIAATNERPKIISDPNMSPSERDQLRSAVFSYIRLLLANNKCLVPQPRWLTVRQLAPAANTIYTPPCVQLHRCAPDSGCCTKEDEVCAPIAGKTVVIPFLLHKADGTMPVVKMQFYNHTQCACVSREKLQNTDTTRLTLGSRIGNPSYNDAQKDITPRREMERQNDWRAPTEEPITDKDDEEDVTAPPQLRRCTCPALFFANITENNPCTCVCDWPDVNKRQDCLSLARGKEHFGLRDRFCLKIGNCTPPTCEFGAYNRITGKCPQRNVPRYRKFRYHSRGRY